MKTMAQTFEEIRRRQQPVPALVFWQQVEAFKVGEEPIQAVSNSSGDWKPGLPHAESLLVGDG